eukprot:Sspe_Gene.104516::Locus_80933_Transcript_1_1_Confidence_1.000_Length_1994::g.104516::m.104516
MADVAGRGSSPVQGMDVVECRQATPTSLEEPGSPSRLSPTVNTGRSYVISYQTSPLESISSDSSPRTFSTHEDSASPVTPGQKKKGWIGKVRTILKKKTAKSLPTAPPGSSQEDLNGSFDLLNGLTGRATGLPPKSKEEALQHAKEIAALNAACKKRAEDEQKRIRKRRKEQEKREREISEAIEIWEQEIFPNWAKERSTRRTRRLWRTGIPEKVRSKLWVAAVGNDLNITPHLFDILRLRGEEARKQAFAVRDERQRVNLQPLTMAMAGDASAVKGDSLADPPTSLTSTSEDSDGDATSSEGDDDEGALNRKAVSPNTSDGPDTVPPDETESPVVMHSYFGYAGPPTALSLKQREHDAALSIDIDLPRTFPNFHCFQEGPMSEALIAVLHAYVQYRPDIGYVQGMSYIAATLLLYLDADKVFVCMANLVNQTHLLPFFRVHAPEIGVHLRLYDLILEETQPELHNHFQEIGLYPQLYVYDWFMTLYSKSLPLDIACRIWDLFLLHESWLYRAACGIIRYLSRELLEGGFDGCFRLLTHLPKEFHLEQCMACITSIKLGNDKYKELKQKAASMDNSVYIPC